jgi:hypothetical protein
MYNYFVLGYNGIDYFNQWYDFEHFVNTNLYIIDNGRQSVPNDLNKHIVCVTTKNIGCAGGWNLVCDIGFNYYGYDKIIVGQEDARVSEEIFEALMEECNPNLICGTYNNSFEFSTYAIHRDTFNKVGRFDENFMFAGCEDNDYKHRCKLNGVGIKSLEVSHFYNSSIANNTNTVPEKSPKHNADYVMNKWGDYKYTEPFDGITTSKYTDYFLEIHGNTELWPSENEFNIFKEKMGVK